MAGNNWSTVAIQDGEFVYGGNATINAPPVDILNGDRDYWSTNSGGER